VPRTAGREVLKVCYTCLQIFTDTNWQDAQTLGQ
jgi:hypothetical protein